MRGDMMGQRDDFGSSQPWPGSSHVVSGVVTSDSDMSPDTAVELVRILDGIDRAIGDVSSE
jgi:hypothetical protein